MKDIPGKLNSWYKTILSLGFLKGIVFGYNKAEERLSQKESYIKELETKIKTYEEQIKLLSEKAYLDPLTGAKNRRYLEEQIKKEINHSLRSNSELAYLIADVDDFKKVNDTYGHSFGDEVLKKVYQAIKDSASRDIDTLVRYGGEEFVVLLPHTDVNGATKVSENILRKVQKHTIALLPKPVTVSIGYSILKPNKIEHETPEEIYFILHNQADSALYNAKKSGKNKAVLFNNSH